MKIYNINELRSGLKIIQDNEPCIVIDSEFIKPGKGQAFNRIKLKNLISGKLLRKIFKSGDSIKSANVMDVNMNYIYNDGKLCFFMNKNNFEQVAINIKYIGNKKKWLTNQVECIVSFWNKKPIIITLPNFVELEIVNTIIGLKNDTVNTTTKLVTLSTGAIVKGPLFLQIGDIIKVDTRSGEYVSRISNI